MEHHYYPINGKEFTYPDPIFIYIPKWACLSESPELKFKIKNLKEKALTEMPIESMSFGLFNPPDKQLLVFNLKKPEKEPMTLYNVFVKIPADN